MFIKRGIIFSLLVALIVTLLPGCSTGSSSINIWPGHADRGTGRISGSTIASETIKDGLRASDGLRGVMSIENASVWLQEHPEIRTTTAPDGSLFLKMFRSAVVGWSAALEPETIKLTKPAQPK